MKSFLQPRPETLDHRRPFPGELRIGRGWVVLVCIMTLLAGFRVGLPYYRMWKLIAAIDRDGGSVVLKPVGPKWLHRPGADPATRFVSCFFKQLADVDLSREFSASRSEATPALLAALAEYQTVRRLDLSGRLMDEADCRQLRRLQGLELLNLSHSGLTDGGLRNLEGLLRLTELSLAGTLVSDEGLQTLKAFPKLRTLAVDGTEIGDAGLESLKSLPRLQTLTVSQTNISESGVQELLQSFPNLNVSDD